MSTLETAVSFCDFEISLNVGTSMKKLPQKSPANITADKTLKVDEIPIEPIKAFTAGASSAVERAKPISSIPVIVPDFLGNHSGTVESMVL